jgi:hypothetical protein
MYFDRPKHTVTFGTKIHEDVIVGNEESMPILLSNGVTHCLECGILNFVIDFHKSYSLENQNINGIIMCFFIYIHTYLVADLMITGRGIV